jgi:hypothetical protein
MLGGLIAVVGIAVAVNAQPGVEGLLPAILALGIGRVDRRRRQCDLQDVLCKATLW